MFRAPNYVTFLVDKIISWPTTYAIIFGYVTWIDDRWEGVIISGDESFCFRRGYLQPFDWSTDQDEYRRTGAS